MYSLRIRHFGLLMVAPLIISACSQEAEKVQEERQVAVTGRVLERTSQEITRTFTGTLVGGEEAVIRAKLAEAVLDVYVKEGDEVDKDERLLALDRTGATSQYQEAESIFRNAEKNYNKMQRLFVEGAISELELDAVKTEYEVAKAGFSAARQLVEIQTPISGTVVSLPIAKGDFVAVGQTIAIISQIDTLRVNFEARLQDLDKLTVGAPVTIESKEITSPIFGNVRRISSSADRQTRTFNVEVEFDNRDHRFRPGMFVRVTAVVNTLKDVVAVPRDAVLRLNGNRVVFVVNGDRALRRDVIIGAELEGKAVITEGVAAGDTVVIVGQNYLEDSLKVNLTDVE